MGRLRDVLTVRGRAFAASGATLAGIGWGLGFPDISRVGVLLLALPLAAGLLTQGRRAAIRVERHLAPNRISVDETATVTVLMENTGTGRTPLLLVEERLDHVLGDRPRFLLGPMAPGERREVQYEVRSHLRGRHTLGPLTVQLRDPFGLTSRFARVGASSEILVLPRISPLNGRRPPGDGVGMEGETPHMLALHGEDDQSIREYRDGDDLRRIHWPATARTGELMVRQEDRPARRRAVILLDPRADAHRGRGTGSSFEWAVGTAASVVAHLSGFGFAVHLICSETVHDGQAATTTEPERALDILAEVSTGSGHELSELVRAAHPITASGGLVVAVLADRDEEDIRQVASLRQPGGTGLAVVIDTASFAEPRQGHATGGARAFAELLRTAGWSVTTATASQSAPTVWAALTARGVLTR